MIDPRTELSWSDGVAIITLRRSDKLNALDTPMIESLAAISDEIDANHSARAAIITGEGKAFSAGGDIKAWAAMKPHEFGFDWIRKGHRAFTRLAELRVPLIAALNGHALGGGFELAATADFRIASNTAKIGMPETSLGMIPGWSGTQRLVNRFGAQVVRRMVLAGEIFLAPEALSLGLIDHIVEPDAVLERAKSYAQQIAARGPAANQTAKLLIATASGEGVAQAAETVASILAANSGDLRDGVQAFSERQAPQFKGSW